MSHNNQDDAILLLTVSFGKSTENAHKPLSNAEWYRLVHWLMESGFQPEDLLEDTKHHLLPDWLDRERVARLLGRGVALVC